MFREKSLVYDPAEKAIEVCEICSGTGHTSENCPKRKEGVVCKVCGQPGHTALYCPNKEAGKAQIEKNKKEYFSKILTGRSKEVEERVKAYRNLEQPVQGEKSYTEAEIIAQVDDFSNQFRSISEKLGKPEHQSAIEEYRDGIQMFLDVVEAQGYKQTIDAKKKIAKLKNTLNIVNEYL